MEWRLLLCASILILSLAHCRWFSQIVLSHQCIVDTYPLHMSLCIISTEHMLLMLLSFVVEHIYACSSLHPPSSSSSWEWSFQPSSYIYVAHHQSWINQLHTLSRRSLSYTMSENIIIDHPESLPQYLTISGFLPYIQYGPIFIYNDSYDSFNELMYTIERKYRGK